MEGIFSIASEIGESLVTPLATEVGYVIYYGKTLKSLKYEIEKLVQENKWVEGLVKAAERDTKGIKDEVKNWLRMVNEMIPKLQAFNMEIETKRGLLYRWSLSRKAEKILKDVKKLYTEGSTYNTYNVAYPAPPPRTVTFTDSFKHFNSRKTIFNEIMEALKKEEVRTIGICGMGGVGKTELVNQIMKRFDVEKDLFEDVLRADVSQKQDIKKIQLQIAEKLGLYLDDVKTDSGGVSRLNQRLKKMKCVLIILEDVWSELNLDNIIGPRQEECKVLLTTRIRDVCTTMKCQKEFILPMLNDEESLELFKETVGDELFNPYLSHLAVKITNECGGLPLAIVTVGKVLEKKDQKHEWDDALQKLQKSQIYKEVFSCIELSYDYLDNDEARSCFLLCSLFPEKYDIPIEYLVRYAWGRDIFVGMDTLENARTKVRSLVDNLKRRFMLLDSEIKGCTKMHDVVRDFAISIASRENVHGHGAFLVRCDIADQQKRWPATATSCSTISMTDVEIDMASDGFKCPKLELLQLENSKYLKDAIMTMTKMFTEMKTLKVLSLLHMDIGDLPSSLEVLKNLRTLCLDGCTLGDVSNVGKLGHLEILSFARSNISLLPTELKDLTQLRLLDTTNCHFLKTIPHDVLYFLKSLEELYMGGNERLSLKSLIQVMSVYDRLKVLVIDIVPYRMLWGMKDVNLKNQTTRFHVSMYGKKVSSVLQATDASYIFDKTVNVVEGDASEMMKGSITRFLLKASETLYLKETKNLKDLLDELAKEDFEYLRSLSIENSKDGGEYLTNKTTLDQKIEEETNRTRHTAFLGHLTSLDLKLIPDMKAVCHSQVPKNGSFRNLRSLHISQCGVIKYVFPLSVAQNLVQLQCLFVSVCPKMNEVISSEWTHDGNVADHRMLAFPKLTKLNLHYVQELRSFCIYNKRSTNPKVADTSSSDQHQANVSSSISNAPIVARSHDLFPRNCIFWLPKIEELEVNIASLDGLFDLEGHHTDMVSLGTRPFSQLRKLSVLKVQQLTNLWKNVNHGFQGFRNLTVLTVQTCDGLEYLFSYSVAKVLVDLEELNISSCKTMETILKVITEEDKQETGSMILFPKLNLRLEDLPRLSSLSTNANVFVWESTKVVYLRGCPKLKTLLSTVTTAPEIKRLEVAGFTSSETSVCFPAGCTPIWSGNKSAMINSDHQSTNKESQQRFSSRADARHSLDIIPHHLIDNKEVTPANMEDSNANDNLECLEVENCESLEVVFQLQENNYVQAFHKLMRIVLKSLPKLMHIWREQGSELITGGFGNLKLLEVHGCYSLRYLFTPSMVKRLINLENIKVKDCWMMEEIVSGAKPKAIVVEEVEELTFPRVNSITLDNLLHFKCVCGIQAYALKWPCLDPKKTIISNCNNVKISEMLFGPTLPTTDASALKEKASPPHHPHQLSLFGTRQKRERKVDEGSAEPKPGQPKPETIGVLIEEPNLSTIASPQKMNEKSEASEAPPTEKIEVDNECTFSDPPLQTSNFYEQQESPVPEPSTSLELTDLASVGPHGKSSRVPPEQVGKSPRRGLDVLSGFDSKPYGNPTHKVYNPDDDALMALFCTTDDLLANTSSKNTYANGEAFQQAKDCIKDFLSQDLTYLLQQKADFMAAFEVLTSGSYFDTTAVDILRKRWKEVEAVIPSFQKDFSEWQAGSEAEKVLIEIRRALKAKHDDVASSKVSLKQLYEDLQEVDQDILKVQQQLSQLQTKRSKVLCEIAEKEAVAKAGYTHFQPEMEQLKIHIETVTAFKKKASELNSKINSHNGVWNALKFALMEHLF